MSSTKRQWTSAVGEQHVRHRREHGWDRKRKDWRWIANSMDLLEAPTMDFSHDQGMTLVDDSLCADRAS